MTRYTKRDIRAADILAMIIVGFGFILLTAAAWPLLFLQAGRDHGTGPELWILAGVFILLGTALNLKVRQLVRNRGCEPEDYPGVPEQET